MIRLAVICSLFAFGLSLTKSAIAAEPIVKRKPKPVAAPITDLPASTTDGAISMATAPIGTATGLGPGAVYWKMPKKDRSRLQANFRYAMGSATTTSSVTIPLLGVQTSSTTTSYTGTIFDLDFFKSMGSVAAGVFSDTGTDTYTSGSTTTSRSGFSDFYVGARGLDGLGSGSGLFYDGFIGLSPSNRSRTSRNSGGMSFWPGVGYQSGPVAGAVYGGKASYLYRLEQTQEDSGLTAKYTGGHILNLTGFYEIPLDKNRLHVNLGYQSVDDVKASSGGAVTTKAHTDILFGGTLFVPMDSFHVLGSYSGSYRGAAEEASGAASVKTDAYIVHNIYGGVIFNL